MLETSKTAMITLSVSFPHPNSKTSQRFSLSIPFVSLFLTLFTYCLDFFKGIQTHPHATSFSLLQPILQSSSSYDLTHNCRSDPCLKTPTATYRLTG